MLERLAQLVVDKLEPKIERIVSIHLDELKLEIHRRIDESLSNVVIDLGKHLNYSDQQMEEIKARLKKEITQQIVRGVKG